MECNLYSKYIFIYFFCVCVGGCVFLNRFSVALTVNSLIVVFSSFSLVVEQENSTIFS